MLVKYHGHTCAVNIYQLLEVLTKGLVPPGTNHCTVVVFGRKLTLKILATVLLHKQGKPVECSVMELFFYLTTGVLPYTNFNNLYSAYVLTGGQLKFLAY